MTKSGQKAKVNHTVAVDPDVIPLGSILLIDGTVYIAEDVGSAVKGHVIDVWVGQQENSFGRKYSEVYILQEEKIHGK